jgi:hypothetical protein
VGRDEKSRTLLSIGRGFVRRSIERRAWAARERKFSMKVMVFIKANADSEAGKTPSEKLITEMMKFNEALVKAGILLAGEGLRPSSAAKRVRFERGQKAVIDGPFSETKELIAGFWMWQVRSIEEAVEWVKRIPNPDNDPGPSEIEIRPVFESEEFGKELSPALRAQEEQLRASVAAQKK